jgi:cytochrome c553
MKRALWKSALSVCLGSILVAAYAVAVEPPAKPDLAKGQTIAAQACAACHGADGNSPTPANPKLAGQVAEYLEKQLHSFKAVQGEKPERDNPVMAGMVANLSPEDMRNVAAYFASQKPKGGVARSRELVSVGQKLYRAGNAATGLPACAGCHGPNGAGVPAQYPRLAGQYAEYTAAQLKTFHEGQRANDTNRMMRSIAAKMNDADMRAVSDYIAGLR